MTDLARWLKAHADDLIASATNELATSDSVKAQVAVAVEAFYTSLTYASATDNMNAIFTLLHHWVEGFGISTADTVGGLVPVLSILKQSTNHMLKILCKPSDGFAYLLVLDDMFTQAIVYASRLEEEMLMEEMKGRLAASEQRIEGLNKSKNDFIAIAAHELKTPLTVIGGYASILRNHKLIAEHTDVEACMTGIESGLNRLLTLVDDIIDVSLIEAGKIEISLQVTWLSHILNRVERQINHSLSQRDISFSVDYDSIPEEPIFADPERMVQVIHNVVMNAIKYTPDRGQVTINGRDLPGFVDIMVADTGIGIDSADLTHIFDPFSMVNEVALHSSGKVKFKGGGAGLGLPIARGIVEAHGGSIWAESPGYDEVTCPGSTFHIMIPMRDVPPDQEM